MNSTERYDIGIVGWWYYYNYGSVLTYLSLYKALEQKGYKPLLIGKGYPDPEVSDLTNGLPYLTIEKYCNVTGFWAFDQMNKLNDICSMFISGSDQMWNPSCEKDAGGQYFLDFVDDRHKKISYASSLGNATDASSEYKDIYKKYVNRFEAVSVREKYSIEACEKIYGFKPEHVCDPVFLCDKSFYIDISENAKNKTTDEYLLCFILDPSDEIVQIIDRISDEKKLRVKCLVDLTDAHIKAKKLSKYECFPYASLEDFLYLFKNSKYIITDSYHGTCFSLIFEKDFISIPNNIRGDKRVKELLSLYGAGDRIVGNYTDLSSVKQKVDYSIINPLINQERKRSWNWLISKVDLSCTNLSNIQSKINDLYENDDFIRVRLLITLLRDYGVKKVVLSPGGRDVPIVRMIEYNDDVFDIYRVTDERSAAYFAMGLSRQSRQIVACVCTSGTAVSNYAPAVTEAFYTGVPLVFITADRQQIYLGMGEDQTIPQKNIFKDITKKEVTLPEGKGYRVNRQIIRDVSDCILETTHNGFGPVHINVSIDNITIGAELSREAWGLLPYIYPHLLRVKLDNSSELMRWVDDAKQSKKIMIVYGQNQVLTNHEIEVIEDFVKKYNCIVLTDHISNLHINGALNAYNMLHKISQEEFDQYLAPDICISVGGKRLMNDPLTYKIRGSKKNIRHWCVQENGMVKDFYMRLSSILEMSQYSFFKFFCQNAGEIKNDNVYMNVWKKYIDNYPTQLREGFHGIYVQSQIFPNLPENCIVHLAVGQVFHDCRLFTIPDTVDVFCNMGTNGIDGCVSTFMGQCAAEKEKLCFLIVGDLSFFYDMNGIWNKELSNNIRIILLNNNGTDLLRSHNLKAISSVHNTKAKGWVESTGFKYVSAESKEELDNVLPWVMSSEPDFPVFLEVFCD